MRTFLFERDLMLLDEPFGALDALTRSLMQRWLLESGSTIAAPCCSSPTTSTRRIYLGDRVVVMTARPGTGEAASRASRCRGRARPSHADVARIHGAEAPPARRDRGGKPEEHSPVMMSSVLRPVLVHAGPARGLGGRGARAAAFAPSICRRAAVVLADLRSAPQLYFDAIVRTLTETLLGFVAGSLSALPSAFFSPTSCG